MFISIKAVFECTVPTNDQNQVMPPQITGLIVYSYMINMFLALTNVLHSTS